MRIPFGLAPSENGIIQACVTFLTDWYLWVHSLWYPLFRLVSSVLSIRKKNGILLLPLFLFFV